jgi:hypothetical protein
MIKIAERDIEPNGPVSILLLREVYATFGHRV